MSKPQVSPALQSMESPSCEVQHPVDLDSLRHLHGQLLSVEKSQRMAEFFSLLGDPNRLRILSALALQELCVCDLAAAVKMSESAVSHQLRSLRAMRLVGYRKQGRNVFYRLKDSHVFNLYREVAEHLDETDD
ncbi:helix-turn-helix transcriptional regulator [Desertifilum sp. FACHB-1129]|uniref:ArsR family transcriptional regulator n=1 Tax=Desertifilum tharense IPPAS B-1220 TaxID=1781255 RepID=A0A1E5QJ74_9CYAN|nr:MULTISPECIES: metalloregulator ArsR/SmtB family transcription factor [Desertifilum]MDA0209515.1 metalloregulator ArsR/SmtB family transcription factor [Cyanobacteria bacterium FC1]MBD2314061.1 helix-turn-helix transcriptional regulator [Desertifilum sp. FACHB-1129]MBD2321027.1 helix-turn-helix transcriptional regulator [Desertifilum sp. FACHB-866]MBD2331156.1 helix-turn-helix transcriptional regulator [Desertifilum sp. FACHB-868]OEJ74668.1 ArsR family transcriptional regulator [Desertifilum